MCHHRPSFSRLVSFPFSNDQQCDVFLKFDEGTVVVTAQRLERGASFTLRRRSHHHNAQCQRWDRFHSVARQVVPSHARTFNVDGHTHSHIHTRTQIQKRGWGASKDKLKSLLCSLFRPNKTDHKAKAKSEGKRKKIFACFFFSGTSEQSKGRWTVFRRDPFFLLLFSSYTCVFFLLLEMLSRKCKVRRFISVQVPRERKRKAAQREVS